MSSRRQGRNARKKVAHRILSQEQDAVEQTPFHSAAGPTRTRKDVCRDAAALFLDSACKELDRCSRTLGSPGCWATYYRLLPEATFWAVQKDFREYTVTAARRFMGRSVRTANVAVPDEGDSSPGSKQSQGTVS